MDTSTFYLLLAMGIFVFGAVIMIHHHNCTDIVKKREGHVQQKTDYLNRKIEVLEQEIVNLKIQIEEVDEKIDASEA